MAPGRDFFVPTNVPEELTNANRRCVEACLAFLGLLPAKVHPTAQQPMPQFSDVLKKVSPSGSIIKPFDTLEELYSYNLDNLYVATMNRGTGHCVYFIEAKRRWAPSCATFMIQVVPIRIRY